MELWIVCFFVLALDTGFGKALSSNATGYVTRQIESCPDVGYFFKRELAPNLVESGPCFLCFCKDNGTAICWERDRRRCDVEKYHHHRVGRHSRYRRSFSNVFFRDATRDFFGKSLPQHCKPYESSFSDGCPPADWCVGCTICDCDSNGQWDCHILSFCDGRESKKKVKLPNNKNKRYKKVKKSLDYDYSDEMRHKKKTQLKKSGKKTTIRPKTTKPPNKNVKKEVKPKAGNKRNVRKSESHSVPKQASFKNKTARKVTRKQNKAYRSYQRGNGSKVIIKNIASTRIPITMNHNAVKGNKLNSNNNETVKMGQKIIKQVITQFKKILAKGVDNINESRKYSDRKDCRSVKKRDRENYNIRSKAVTKNKNKYKRSGIIKENYTNTRRKRETFNQGRVTENLSVITLPTDTKAVITNNATKEELPVNETSSPLILRQDHYNEYYIKTDSSLITTTASTTIKNVEKHINLAKNLTIKNVVTELEENDIQNNMVIPLKSNKINESNDMKNMSSNINDMKLSRWYLIKIKNSEGKKQVTKLILPKTTSTKSFDYEKNTDKDYFASMLKTKHFEPKIAHSKKYRLTSVVSRVHRKPCDTKAIKIKQASSNKKVNATGLKSMLENLLIQLNKTNEAKLKKKSEVSILKYIRNFFHRIFSKKRSATHKVYGLGTKEDHTLQILCENVGPCKIKRNNRMILKQKLNKLNKETKAVLKSIRNVKGLLHLLELPDSDKTLQKAKNNSFQNDIRKLGIILKNYKEGDENSALTFTQKTQIEYIKKNTQTFIECVRQFAEVLTDILAIIKPNENDQLPQKQQTHTSLTKIKKILYQYNIMQNTFMKKMYELISGEEKRTTTTEKMITRLNDMDIKSIDQVIDKYSTNIIENLRKLKNIAQVLSNKRKKRDLLFRDDALEYLLMLMEVLLSQNLPSDTAPAQDGIDLLLDAIKNAPDIKPVTRKKMLYEARIPFHQLVNTRKSEHEESNSDYKSSRTSNAEKTIDSEDNIVNIKNLLRPGKTFNQDNFLERAKNKSKTLLGQTTSENATDKIYYRKFNQENNDEDATTSDYNSITKKRSFEEYEITGFDKLESYINDSKNFETETNDVEDDDVDITTYNTPVRTNEAEVVDNKKDHQALLNVPRRTTAIVPLAKEISSESQDFNDRRSKIEWVDEHFDRENKITNFTTSSVAPTRTSVRPTLRPTKKKVVNNSDISSELENYISHVPINETDSHDVLHKKQIQFLNSLDYGTERAADFEDTKDDDNKSDDILFPAYFV